MKRFRPPTGKFTTDRHKLFDKIMSLRHFIKQTEFLAGHNPDAAEKVLETIAFDFARLAQ